MVDVTVFNQENNTDGVDGLVAKKRRTVLKFTAPWCAPCRQMKPIIKEVLSGVNDDDVQMIEIDIDECDASLVEKYAVKGVPTLIMLSDGVETDRHIGLMQKQKLQSWFDKK